MPDFDLSFLAAAYENGQTIGRVVRWLVLLAVGFKLTQRLLTGSFGSGFRRSRAGTILGLVVVVAGLLGSVRYDFTDNATASAGRDMNAARAEVVRGCLDQGQVASVCECYGDEVLRRTGSSQERFAALERDMVSRQDAGQAPPDLIVQAAQACVGKAG